MHLCLEYCSQPSVGCFTEVANVRIGSCKLIRQRPVYVSQSTMNMECFVQCSL